MVGGVMDRFWSKVDASGVCWEWTGALSRYGYFGLNGTNVLAHRYSWETLIGPIPEGCEIDHLCKNKKCVNPDHLEPVTRRVNTLRANGPSCKRGHILSGDNLVIRKTRPNVRECRACRKIWNSKKEI